MLDSRTIEIVKSTVPLLESANTALTEHFYKRMFRDNPELKDVFNLSHQKTGRQPAALFAAVLAYAKNIDNPAVLSAAVERIAHKHTGFSIQPAQYDIVGHHLLETIKELAPDAATPEVIDAWAQAYGALAGIFIGREEQLYQQSEQKDGGWRGHRTFVVKEKRVESEQIVSFLLVPEDGGAVADYLPGQYLNLHLDSPELEHKEYRQYSLCQAANGREYRIAVKREPGGVASNFMHDKVQVGDQLQVLPPAGDFFMEVSTETPVVLISGGVGLTPMRAMLDQLLTLGHQADIHWLHACDNGAQHAFKNDIQQRRQAHVNLNTHIWYRTPAETDQPAEDYHAEGLMNLAKVKDAIALDGAHYYFCGPLPFMAMVKEQLSAWGIEDSRLHYEVFGPHQAL
ncbi:NO-inducible flavohemoprotein [Oceanisphaera arctica]|uniref:Flavohemoprotein n=1 Tax=Oceanisphaera arctica TaxID=641510 RepID=A0A2P5TQ91_9GAMM|nr:NO-inducible flavohemoprotein [Oceanisphaera arctica]PPL17899.1 nitric oxide dioxygenase [Oceanisphaera arctica]GHA23890.1 flavohemoprotein [Oceanisphaera arctica]